MSQDKLFELAEKAVLNECSQDFWESCVNALSDSGVAGIGYGFIPSATEARLSGNSKSGVFKHTYPSQWEELVDEERPVDKDVTVELIIDGCSELLWHDPSLWDEACEDSIEQNERELDIGMQFGASIALHQNAFEQSISGVGLWVNHTHCEEEFSDYWKHHRKQIYQICHILDEGLRGRHAKLLVPLSPREHDCLTYLAIGLRPAEICWRLSISEKTFEKHIKGAKQKLHAKTRDHAVAKALVLNLIQP